jgi:hypothetical protein
LPTRSVRQVGYLDVNSGHVIGAAITGGRCRHLLQVIGRPVNKASAQEKP